MSKEPLDINKINRLKGWTTFCQVMAVPVGFFCIIFLIIIAGEGFTLAAFLVLAVLVLLVMQVVSLTLIRKLLTDLATDPPNGPTPAGMGMDMGE